MEIDLNHYNYVGDGLSIEGQNLESQFSIYLRKDDAEVLLINGNTGEEITFIDEQWISTALALQSVKDRARLMFYRESEPIGGAI